MTAKTTLRISLQMLEQVQNAAKEDHRSANQQIIYYICKALEERKQEPQPPFQTSDPVP